MGGALALVALVFLGYDLAKGKLSPCDAIFQESSLGLSTRISFLKTEGELQIGRDLQFIRINGTVVGGLAGLAIHAIGQLLG